MKKTSALQLAKDLGISKQRGIEAIFKAKMIAALKKTIGKEKITHEELAAKSSIPRSAVTGILSGSLQKVSLERILRLLFAAGLMPEIKIKKAA
jgi:predicted XRE-type DNA-binding protein